MDKKSILLYGNGFNNMLINHSKKDIKTSVDKVSLKIGDKVISEKNIAFDFSLESFYDYFETYLPNIFVPEERKDFFDKTITKNLEEVFSDTYFEKIATIADEKGKDALRDVQILLNDSEIQWSKKYIEIFLAKDDYISEDEYVIFINKLFEQWITFCYQRLKIDSSKLSRRIRTLSLDKGEEILVNFVKFDYYWTTNFSKDDVLLKAKKHFFINGTSENMTKEIIFDGLISRNKTKEALLLMADGDERKKLLENNHNYIETFEVRTPMGYGKYDFEIHIFGFSPIHDEPLMRAIQNNKNIRTIFFYYHDIPRNENWNARLKMELFKYFDVFYFVPSTKFKLNENDKKIADYLEIKTEELEDEVSADE